MNWCTVSLINILSISFFGCHAEQNPPSNSIERYKTFIELINVQEIAWLDLLQEDVRGRIHLREQHTREWAALQIDMLTRISDKTGTGDLVQELITRAIILRRKQMYEWEAFKQGLAKKASTLQENQRQQIDDFEK